ncbi:hypothetical protein AMECASPLE_039528 [Ameca splendens]|uniref:Uncharacterized protein n=1 Tax=Ameca splendens TaxID=208324 RepID=A0ABV0Y8E5_9TELE
MEMDSDTNNPSPPERWASYLERPINSSTKTDGNRAVSPAPTCVSMKSDVSKDLPPFLSDVAGLQEQR